MNLEVLYTGPGESCSETNHTGTRAPLLFVHGAFTGAWCWSEHYMDYFARNGWSCAALSLRGHGESDGGNPHGDPADSSSLADYARDVISVAQTMDRPPILVGHSMGGMVVQKAVEMTTGDTSWLSGMILMCSPSPFGLAASNVRMAFQRPSLYWTLMRLQSVGPRAASPKELVKAMFHQPPKPEDLARYYRLLRPESARAAMDMTWLDIPRWPLPKSLPLFILGAQDDPFVSPEETQLSANLNNTQATILPDIGHAMMLDGSWRSSAELVLKWLNDKFN